MRKQKKRNEDDRADPRKIGLFSLVNQDEIPVFEDTIKKETVLMLS